MVFSADGDFLSKIGKDSIFSLSIDDDNNVLYTSNPIKGQISVFTLEGDVLYSFSAGKLIVRTLWLSGGWWSIVRV